MQNLNDYIGVVKGDTRNGHDDDWNRVRLTIDIDFVVNSHRSSALETAANVFVNGRNSDETALELNYAAQVTGWLLVQPAFEYYFNPGGSSRREDAVLLGARTKVVF